jgi:hypothetical protein
MTFDAAFLASSLEAFAAALASFLATSLFDFGFLLGGDGEFCSLGFEGFYTTLLVCAMGGGEMPAE